MNQPPDITLGDDGSLKGFETFDNWCRCNNHIWNWAHKEAMAAGLTLEDRIKFIAATLGRVMFRMIEGDVERARIGAQSIIFAVPNDFKNPNEQSPVETNSAEGQ